jgi:hypothetical protein
VFPELLVASEVHCTAHIWNVVTGKIIECYSLLAGLEGDVEDDEEGEDFDGEGRQSINYVELSASHIFVCFGRKLVVYRREPPRSKSNGEQEERFTDVGIDPSPHEIWKEATPIFTLPKDHRPDRYATCLQNESLSGSIVDPDTPPMPTWSNDRLTFSAVHVSPDGLDLVATSWNGPIYYVRKFASIRTLRDGLQEGAERADRRSEDDEQRNDDRDGNDTVGQTRTPKRGNGNLEEDGERPRSFGLIIPDSFITHLAFDGRRIAFTMLVLTPYLA